MIMYDDKQNELLRQYNLCVHDHNLNGKIKLTQIESVVSTFIVMIVANAGGGELWMQFELKRKNWVMYKKVLQQKNVWKF